MNKTKLISIFVLGFLLGAFAMIKLFAIKDVNIFALPYKNQGVVLKEQMVIEQNGISLTLPKGTELNVLYNAPEGTSIYYLPLTFGPYQEPQTDYLSTQAKFFVESTVKENAKSNK